MASKRKYQGDEQSISSPPTKAAKTEITRSGRVRKKPSKFADDVVSDDTAIAKPPTTAATPRMEMHPAAPVVQIQSPKSQPSVKPETKPEPEPVVTMVTVPLTVPLAVSEPIDDSNKTSGRAGRMRKKSAKVLEMEEFEEAEKKQVPKKTPNTDPNKKAATPADITKQFASHMALMAASQPAKKSQQNLEFDTSQGSATITTKLLASPTSGVKIMDITTSPTQEPVLMISPRIVAKTAGITKSPASVDELAAEQAGKGSVIKLLLSSPSQSTGPVVTTTSFNQGSSSADKTPVAQKKKSKAKSKIKPSPEARGQTDPYISSPLKVASPMIKLSPGSDELVQAKSLSQMVEPLTVDTTLTMAAMSPTNEAKDGLKMKILLSPTQKTTQQKLLTKALASPVKVDKVVTAKNVVKESKHKKGKKASQSEKDTFLAPSLPTPVVHVPIDISNIGIQAAHEATVVISGKKKSGKATPYKEKAPMDTSPMMDDEYGLDLSEITLGEPGEDSLMQIDEDNGLLISEDVLETTKAKPVKKKAKAKTGGKKDSPRLGDVSNTVVGNSLVMDFQKMKSEDKQKKKMKEPPEPDKNKKKRAPTAYMLWCTSHRTRVVKDNPGIDFSTVSKTLGEMWSGLPEKEKMMWKRKAKKAAGKGSTIITTGKAHQASKQMLQPVAAPRHATTPKPASALSAAILASDENLVSPTKGFGIEPIDAAAHLKILGESLGIIGMKLQEHRGLIAVQGSLSVLLDTMLCALGPLMCLTTQLPETDACSHETHMKTLDNIAYFMPGL